ERILHGNGYFALLLLIIIAAVITTIVIIILFLYILVYIKFFFESIIRFFILFRCVVVRIIFYRFGKICQTPIFQSRVFLQLLLNSSIEGSRRHLQQFNKLYLLWR